MSGAVIEDQAGDLGVGPHVHGRAAENPGWTNEQQTGHAVRVAAGEAQGDRGAHRNAAGDETVEAGLIGGGQNIVGEHREAEGAARRGSSRRGRGIRG